VLSQFTDEGTGHPTLKDYIEIPGVYAAGRLDRDSEGLLLLTDDGSLIKRLTDPKLHVEKTYWVLVEGEPAEEALERLRNGIRLKGYTTRPANVRLIPDPSTPARPSKERGSIPAEPGQAGSGRRPGLSPRSKPVTPHGPTFWLEVKLREGKKRQIRHMTAAVGLFTLRLVRVAIGNLQLGELPMGKWRELTPEELYDLKNR
jgi:23S rRNA pseudouridine2457 synthase